MIWYCLRLPYVVSSCDFVHASIKPPECRAAAVKITVRNLSRAPRNGGGGMPITVTDRLPFAEWRHFSDSQARLISNYECSRFYLDQTRAFSISPPQFTIVPELELYLRWFTWKSDAKATLDADLQQAYWLDGAKRCVGIRQAHVADVTNYFNQYTASPDNDIRLCAVEIFAVILGPIYMEHRFNNCDGDFGDLYKRYVDITNSKRTVMVFQHITPFYIPNFLVYILLTMGRFVTEADLYSVASLASAFCRAQIFNSENVREAEIKTLARRYVVQQLLWLPVGSRTFGRRLQELLDGLFATFGLRNNVETVLPLVYDEDISQSIKDHAEHGN